LIALAQACSAAGGPDVLTGEVLPQLLPLFSCTPTRRAAYGCTIPSAPAAGAQQQGGLQAPPPAPNQAAPSVQALQRRMQDRLQLAMSASVGSAGMASLLHLPLIACRQFSPCKGASYCHCRQGSCLMPREDAVSLCRQVQFMK
jgi:hypothetical protein